MADKNEELVEQIPDGTEEGATPPDPMQTLREELKAQRDQDREFYASSMQTLTRSMEGMQQAYNAGLANQQAGNAPKEPEIADVTDAQIAAAAEEGNWTEVARLSRVAATAAAKRETRVLRDTTIAPLIGQVQNIGIPAVERLTRSVVESSFDETTKAAYLRHKDAIATHIANMPPEARLDANAIRGALAYELGMEAMSGGLAKSIDEAAERKIRSTGQPQLKTGQRGDTSAKQIDYEAIFGADGARAAKEKGGWDAFAQTLGYDNMDAYCEATGVDTLQ